MALGERNLVPVLLALFRRFERSLTGAPALLILDEAWVMLGHPVFREKIRDWLKTLRKANCAVVLATQSPRMRSAPAFSTCSSNPVRRASCFPMRRRTRGDGRRAWPPRSLHPVRIERGRDCDPQTRGAVPASAGRFPRRVCAPRPAVLAAPRAPWGRGATAGRGVSFSLGTERPCRGPPAQEGAARLGLLRLLGFRYVLASRA